MSTSTINEYPLSCINEYACIVIGDEILDGHIKDTNLNCIINTLAPIGYSLKEAHIVSDEVDDIANIITAMRKKYSFVITTGGIGPTHDDRTMEGYAKSFECALVPHPVMKEFLFKRPRDTDEKIQAAHKMSILPEGAEVVLLDDRWPLLKMHNCYIMPGVPSICQIVVEKLASILPERNKKYYAECYVSVGEHEYFLWLQNMSTEYPMVSFGSYPLDINDDKRTSQGFLSKMTLSSTDLKAVKTCYAALKDYVSNTSWQTELIPYE